MCIRDSPTTAHIGSTFAITNPRPTVPRLDQLSASGAPTRSGSVTNFADSISGDASAQSSDRGTIHQVLAISASNVPDRPLLFHLATRLLTNEGSAVAPNAPAIASSGIWTSTVSYTHLRAHETPEHLV